MASLADYLPNGIFNSMFMYILIMMTIIIRVTYNAYYYVNLGIITIFITKYLLLQCYEIIL